MMEKSGPGQKNPRYTYIDHTADAGFIAYGGDLKELFKNAAEAMWNLIADIDRIEPRQQREIDVKGANHEELLVGWLQELVYLFDVDRMLFCSFNVHRVDDVGCEATAWGEPFDERRHVINTAVKAVTYHGLEVKRKNGTYEARVIIDI
jgi:SHS2 domain-containing protein